MKAKRIIIYMLVLSFIWVGCNKSPTSYNDGWSVEMGRLDINSLPHILFTAGTYWGTEVYTMHTDGSGMKRQTYTGDTCEISFASWLSNGDGIVFEKDRDLYIMTEKGSKRLTEGYIPLSFPDGSKIAFLRDKIYTINIDGSGLEQITDNKVGEIGWFPYDLSPDGLRFVYCTEGGYWDKDFIWVVNSDGSGEKTILSNMWDPFDPVWSPNGSKVAFSAIARDSSGCTSYTVHIVDADGSNLIRIYKPYTHDTHPLWSPDGSRILFGSLQYREDDQEDLWIMDADGSNQRRLTYNHCVEPEWSPDGSKIVYMCDEGWTTAWQIWIMDADGSNQTKLTHLNVGAGHPKWQPNR